MLGKFPNDYETGDGAGDQASLRERNLRAVLDVVLAEGTVTRGLIGERTGLSKPTVSGAVTALLESGLLRDAGSVDGASRPGPNALLFELNPTAGYVAGIDIGGTLVRGALADLAGNVVARAVRRTSQAGGNRVVQQLVQLIERLVADADADRRSLVAVAVSSPGVFNREQKAVDLAFNIPGWGAAHLIERLETRIEAPVVVDNDVNLAALGEQARGLARGVRDFVFLAVGTGVGMGVVLDGKVLRGAHGAAGEIAYLPLSDGVGADSRRGMLEERAGASGIVENARARLKEAGHGSSLDPDGLTSEAVFEAATRGDAVALDVVRDEARALALAVAAVSVVIDPELVVIGGGIGSNGAVLLEPLTAFVEELAPFPPRIAMTELGSDASLWGSVDLALQEGRRRLFPGAR